MTPIHNIFVSYDPCTIEKRVQITDGAVLKIAGINSVYLEPVGTLHYVLHFARLIINLNSAQRLVKFDE